MCLTNFNPHLPCGRWHTFSSFACASLKFQSTPSLRKVTCFVCFILGCFFISIHTFLAEGDLHLFHDFNIAYHFNPHLPCGRWRRDWEFFLHLRRFQSTPSLRKVTPGNFLMRTGLSISIHTFLAEGDRKNIYNYFFIMHIFMHYILSYL